MLSWGKLFRNIVEENKKRCICLHSPSSNRMVSVWYLVPYWMCRTWSHFFMQRCCLCLSSFHKENVLRYLRYNVNCFLNNNSGEPDVALLNNFALLSKHEIRSFTLLKFLMNYSKKTTPKDSHLKYWTSDV